MAVQILSLISPKVPLGLLTALIRDVRPSVTGPYELEFRLFPSPAELLEPHYNASLDLKLLWHLSNIQSTVDMWNLAAPATVLGSGVSEYDEWLREDLASVMSFSRAPSVASPLKETSVLMLAALEDISENELTSSMDSALRIVHATLVLKTLISLHSKQEKPEPLPFDLDELLNRLRDCRFLQGRLSPNIWAKAKLTGANLNQSERRSVPYLLALEQCRHDEEGEAALDLSAFTAHFGAMILNELPVYLAHLNALRWLRTPLDLRALERCVAFTKIVKHPVVRNALILVLFTDMIAPKLRSIVEVVEKGRRAPQDIVAVRTTGLDRTAALAFLASSLALLENITMEAGCVGTSEMVQDATEAFRVPPLKSVEAFADETLGAILRVLEGEQQVISGKVTNEFKSLIKFLRTLFLHDIRIVRPSKLFDESVNRATSLLRPEDWSEEDLAFDEVLISERHAFVTKLPSPSESPF
ncbi:hypothetical protein HK101_010542 [Irineochytrium annulatum]|nr:hypothetical protein HK101_010542 [Irineochytrium annulatum]